MNELENGIQKKRGTEEFPENRILAAERLVRFLNMTRLDILNGRKIGEVFKDESSTREFLRSLEPEKYQLLITGINALIRNKDTEEEWAMDGEGVRMGTMDIFPDQTEKAELLDESLKAAQSMIKDGRSTEDIALLLSVTLTAVHPFVDGNGRTARFILTLLLKGYDPKLIQEVLVSDGASNLVSAGHFQDVALNVLENEFVPSEKYPTFDKHFFESKEYNAKVVEVIIDTIKNDTSIKYKGWLNEDPEVSSLQTFKDGLSSRSDTDLYNKLFS